MTSLGLTLRPVLPVFLIACLGTGQRPTQEPDASAVVRRIDAAAQSRYENVLGFTDIEHYAVYRGDDQTQPAAEMTVKTTYEKGVGKSYAILSQSGSEIIQRFGLRTLLDNEKNINLPGQVQRSWFTSANYEMKVKPGAPQPLDGRDCLALAVTPRHKAANAIEGTVWVDAKDGSLVRIEGVGSKSPSVFAGPAHMMRQYANMNGFSMATHARAESSSRLFGRTVVTIDYSDYQFQLRPAN